MFKYVKWSLRLVIGVCVINQTFAATANPVSMSQLLEQALAQSPKVSAIVAEINQMRSQAEVADSLPDPTVSFGVANLPADSFDFRQENMTQVKIAVQQMFPRGDSQTLSQSKWLIKARQKMQLLELEKANIVYQVSLLWLEMYRAQQSIELIDNNRSLFEQAFDIANASYSSALGRTRQRDLVRAQLELTRLDDRRLKLKQQLHANQLLLSEWLQSSDTPAYFSVSTNLPDIQVINEALLAESDFRKQSEFMAVLNQHPALQVLDSKVAESKTEIELAEQTYRPQWGVNASYGFRDDAPNNISRSDFLSVAVTFDLPIFASTRQDPMVRSARYQSESMRYQRKDKLRNLLAQMQATHQTLTLLIQRRELYSNRLLEQMNQQVESALTAYTNDDGEFNEVIRSRIDQLNAQMDEVNIQVDFLKAVVKWNYFNWAVSRKATTIGVQP